MKTNLSIIAVTVALIIGPSACSLFQSCPEVSPYFSIEGLETDHMKLTNSSSIGEPITTGEIVEWDKYILHSYFKKSFYASTKFNFGGSLAYALSCIESGYSGSEVGVESLYLIALKDYNLAYQKNDTLNNIINIRDLNDIDEVYSLSTYIGENNSGIQYDSFEIVLTEAPEGRVDLEFELVYILTSGEVFKERTTTVSLRN